MYIHIYIFIYCICNLFALSLPVDVERTENDACECEQVNLKKTNMKTDNRLFVPIDIAADLCFFSVLSAVANLSMCCV